MNEKHGGSGSAVFDKLEKLFPPWNVTRDFWQAALRQTLGISDSGYGHC